MDPKVAQAIRNIVDYNWADEFADFCENPGENHIFVSLVMAKVYVETHDPR